MAKIRKYIFEAGSNCSSEYEMVPVKVGDTVFFKCDIEQYGRVVEIIDRRDRWNPDADAELVLENEAGFGGDYLRYATRCTQMASDCSTAD